MSDVESKNKNYQITRQALVLVIVIILLIAGSYSWLTFSKTSDKVNIIKSGDLSLELEEDTEILLQKAVPMSDAKGTQTQKYIFRLKNEGSSPIKYDMFIDKIIPDQTEELQDKDVRYKLVNNGVETIGNLNDLENRKIESGIINAKSVNNYTLQVWINKDAENDVMNKTFVGKLRIQNTK